jgi:hypothetical protein
MTKKNRSRFTYLEEAQTPEAGETPPAAPPTELQSVPRGQGRMEQDRTQLNVRVPTLLKRRAAAQAVLEGRTLGDVVEELLQQYLEKPSDTQ